MMHPIYRYRDDDYRFPESRRPEGQEASSASPPIERRRRRQQSTADAPYQEERPRSAYYTPLDNERREVPANPYAPGPQQRRQSPAPEKNVQMQEKQGPQSFFAEDGSEYEAPAMPQLPEWYRIAQQNAGPVDERRRNTPMVRTATVFEPEEAEIERDVLGRPLHRNAPARANMPSSKEDFYERAGYPPELVREQRRISEEESLQQNRRRHGAQQAAPAVRQETRQQPPQGLPRRRPLTEAEQQRRQELVQRYQADYEEYAPREQREYPAYPQRDYRPARQEAPGRMSGPQNGYEYSHRDRTPMRAKDYEDYETYEEYYEEETALSPVKILKTALIVAIFAAAIAAAFLFVFKLRYTEETTRILNERQKAEERILQQHPIEYREWIEREARKNNLHPAFVAALIMNESSYRPDAESNVGARGLMQVMEPTAADIAEELGIENYSFDMLYEPETNIIFGCYYLGQLSERFRGDPVCVSASYHAGAQQVQNWLNTSRLSPDGITLKLENMEDGPTKQYATRVTRDFAIYQRLYFSDWEGRE